MEDRLTEHLGDTEVVAEEGTSRDLDGRKTCDERMGEARHYHYDQNYDRAIALYTESSRKKVRVQPITTEHCAIG